MNGKQAKRARAAANSYATNKKLWAEGEKSVYSKWWRRVLAQFFPKLRKRYTDAVGRWYKSVLKSISRQAFGYIHDKDAQEFERVRARIKRKERAKKSRKWIESMREAT